MIHKLAALRAEIRSFFQERQVTEVDPPLLQTGANLDHGVSPLSLQTTHGLRYLPTSPEHALKRLLCANSGDIWALTPAFRNGEHGSKHRTEFRMLEWYRLGFDHLQLAHETVDLCNRLCQTKLPVSFISYTEAFQQYAQIDPRHASTDELRARLGSLITNSDHFSHAELLDLVLTQHVEPQLGTNDWCILCDYPPEQAAQARIIQHSDGQNVAARFELYRNGIELANGYHECTDANDMRQRFEHELSQQTTDTDLIIDEAYLTALHTRGLPDCAGVALGFERIAMIAFGKENIQDISDIL